MHEIMLNGKGGKKVYLDSGPGPQTAIGDDDIAYFGEVTNAELFTMAEFQALMPDFAGATVQFDSDTWLKFKYYGKYLFIKKRPSLVFIQNTGVAGLLSWKAMYERGLIYGSDDTGPWNLGTPTLQIRTIDKAPYRFKVRTITGDTNFTTTLPTATGNDNTVRRKSMFTELLYRLCSYVIPVYTEAKFAQKFAQEITAGSELTCEITSTGAANLRPVFRLMTVDGTNNAPSGFNNAGFGETSSQAWRPVLELLGPKDLLIPRNLMVTGATGYGNQLAAVTANIAEPTGSGLSRLTDIAPLRVNIKPVVVSYDTSIAGLRRLSSISPLVNNIKPVAAIDSVFTP